MMNEDATDEEVRPDAALLHGGGEHDDDYGEDRNEEEGNDGISDDGGTEEEEEEEEENDDDDDDDNDDDGEEEEEEEKVDPSLCMMAGVQYCDVFSALQDERIFDKFPIGDAAKTLDALLRLKVAKPGEDLIETFLKLHSTEDQDAKQNSQKDQGRSDEITVAAEEAANNENEQPYIMNNIVEYTVIVDVCHLIGFRPDRPRVPDPEDGSRQITLSYAVVVLIKLLRCLGNIHGRTTASYTKRNLFDDFQLLMMMNMQERQAVLDFFDQSLTTAAAAAAERTRVGRREEQGESLICKAWPSKFLSFVDNGHNCSERDLLSIAGVLVGHYDFGGQNDDSLDELVYSLYENMETDGSRDGRIVKIGMSNYCGDSSAWLPVLDRSHGGRWPCPSSFSNLTMLQELHLNGCTSLVSIPSLKKLCLKDAELDMKCLQDLCFPQLELLQIEPNAETRDKHVSCSLVSNDISPCLKHFKLKGRSSPEEDLIRCIATLTSCAIPKTVIHFDLTLNSMPRQVLETLVVDLAPNLGDDCVIKVGTVERENVRWLASKLKSAPPISIRYLVILCRPSGSDNEEDETWKTFEYIADKCNAILHPHGLKKAPKSYVHKFLVRHAGNNLLDPNDITNIKDKKNLPISVWPTILQRADEKSNLRYISYRLVKGRLDSEGYGDTGEGRVNLNDRTRIHSGLFHLLRYGPILSHLSGDVGYYEKKNKKKDLNGDRTTEDDGDDDDEPTTMKKRKSCAVSSSIKSTTSSNLEKKTRNT